MSTQQQDQFSLSRTQLLTSWLNCQYTFTHSTHTLMLNWHRGVSHAEGMLCSEELTQAPNIK